MSENKAVVVDIIQVYIILKVDLYFTTGWNSRSTGPFINAFDR